jgi:diadenosine tetraphosphate (Ap4A) HIT family hydrolase
MQAHLTCDPNTPYDPHNIFARIIRGEIPCNTVYDDAHVLAFHDIHPQAPVHILIIPKGPYRDFTDFSKLASSDEIFAFARAIHHVIAEHSLQDQGYRLIANTGSHGGQEVPHYHVHLCAGHPLGPMLSSA